MRISKSQLDEILKKNKHISVEIENAFACNEISGKPTFQSLRKLAEKMKEIEQVLEFTVPGMPISCPRMTQRDKWMKRPCVMKYREYSDRLRKFINLNDLYVGRVEMRFFLPMPTTWSKKKKIEMLGKPHQVKPDWDNLAKGVQDALLQNDSMIWQAYVEKSWVFNGFERTELKFSIK